MGNLLQLFVTLNMLFLAPANTMAGVANPAPDSEDAYALYRSIPFESEQPDFDIFLRGLKGYHQLKEHRKLSDQKEILTLIDFRRSANQKRLWSIDLANKKVLFHSLVAHGRNSGDVYATKFSNTPESNQSSLGFYVTGDTYIGKHGKSLLLDGMEKGLNDQARSRAIVMHGAHYVSEAYIQKVGRLGRSLGCPAVPLSIYEEMIGALAHGTVVFVYHSDEEYARASSLGKYPEENVVISK